MCVCVCVCMYVHTYVCMYVCMYVYMYVHTYVCMYVSSGLIWLGIECTGQVLEHDSASSVFEQGGNFVV